MLIDLSRLFLGKKKTQKIARTDISSRPRAGYWGVVDVIGQSEGIAGWVFDASNPGKAQTVLIMLGEHVIGTAVTSKSRPDISSLFGSEALCAFSFDWSQVLRLPENRPSAGVTLSFLVLGTDVHLNSLPDFPSIDAIYAWNERAQPSKRGANHEENGTDEELDDAVFTEVGLDSESTAERLFDSSFYLRWYPDVKAAGVEPAVHYNTLGWRELRDPNPYFSSSYYLSSNPDVAAADINPFEHYVNAGFSEGRFANPIGTSKIEFLSRLKSLEDQCLAWTRSESVTLIDAQRLAERLRGKSRRFTRGLVVSFSHDNFSKNTGGVQLCIALEQLAFAKQDCCYVHISPWQAQPTLSQQDTSLHLITITVDNETIGSCRLSDLSEAFEVAATQSPVTVVAFIVHALHGHQIDTLIALNKQLSPRSRYFWLHDYFSICTGYNLLRNQIDFCNAPKADSNSCGICVYGESRPQHVGTIARLFQAIDFTVISPSQFAATLWAQSTDLNHSALVVQPHCEIVEKVTRVQTLGVFTPKGELKLLRPLRVAFLGHQSEHKGWSVFQDLVRQLCGSTDYEFLHLGTQREVFAPVGFREVKVTGENPNQMVDALMSEGVDAVLIWSSWPETFCITAHEAMAAGAVVIAPRVSGNVPELIAKTGLGIVFENEDDLFSEFKSGAIAKHLLKHAERGMTVGKLQFSEMTASVVAENGISRNR
jgi:glycosyltransferase involved in cell wall biosynthesis